MSSLPTSNYPLEERLPRRGEGTPNAALYRIAAGGLVAGAALTLLSSLLSPEATDASLKVASASPLHYPTAIVGVILLVVCIPAVFIRLREVNRAPLALCGTFLIVAAGIDLTFGLGFAAGMGLTSELGFTTLLALPWSVMLPLPQLSIDGGPALPNVFFILSTIVVGLGGVLLGVAVLRAGLLRPAMGVALIVCTLLSVTIGFLPLQAIPRCSAEAVYMTGLALLGAALWRVSGPSLIPKRKGRGGASEEVALIPQAGSENTPFRITDINVVPPGAGVAALARYPDQRPARSVR